MSRLAFEDVSGLMRAETVEALLERVQYRPSGSVAASFIVSFTVDGEMYEVAYLDNAEEYAGNAHLFAISYSTFEACCKSITSSIVPNAGTWNDYIHEWAETNLNTQICNLPS